MVRMATTMIRITTAIAEPSGQFIAIPNWVATTLAIMFEYGPPTRMGEMKSPAARQKVKVKPARIPGTESGRVIFRKVR
jgi:hypothetical protein